ncbi:hypothetical protein HMPREF1546_01419 [Oscillibacter sp. KLE 1745]|nr:hypothetical protein HMPREF1546_01419 [Oscillibacter sp. KLE 1745]
MLGRNPALRQLGLCWAMGRLVFYLNFPYTITIDIFCMKRRIW